MGKLLRIVGIIVGLLAVAGFGFCGLFGLSVAARGGGEFAQSYFRFGLLGLGIAAVAGFIVWLLLRRRKP